MPFLREIESRVARHAATNERSKNAMAFVHAAGVNCLVAIVLTISISSDIHAGPLTGGPPDAAHLIFVTEDVAQLRQGCETISVFDDRLADPVLLGRHSSRFRGAQISPGRLTATRDLSIVVAAPTNQGLRSGILLWRWDASRSEWEGFAPESGRITLTRIGGVAIGPDDDTLLVATTDGVGKCPRDGYSVTKFLLSEIDFDAGTLGPVRGRLALEAPVAEIVFSHTGIAHAITAPFDGITDRMAPSLVSIDVPSMTARGPAVALETIGEYVSCYGTLDSVSVTHAALSPDGRYLVTNRWVDQLNVVDLDARSASAVDLPGLSRSGGIAFNHDPDHGGVLAVHGVSRLGVYRFVDGTIAGPIASVRLPPPLELVDNNYYGNAGSGSGPVASIAWSGDGTRLIAASGAIGGVEFRTFAYDPVAGSLEPERSYEACPITENNFLNGILTGNGILPTRTPSASATPTPSRTAPPTAAPTHTATGAPTSTATRTRTPHPTASPTLRPTHTSSPPPPPIYLPLALDEHCDPRQVRVDVALVIDASSSMREPATSSPGNTGGTGTKLDAALSAVSAFLDLLALDEGDRAAIVSFNDAARIHADLTADRAALNAALATIETAQHTRLDLAIDVGRDALLGAPRDPANERILVLLTDGRANPVPVEVAVARATDAKEAGITLFTIGLGADLDVAALRRIATKPAFFLRAPSAATLEAAYAEIARLIPCPGAGFWGGR